MPVEIRLAVEGDIPYVAKTWVETYRKAGQWSKGMTDGVYYPAHRNLANHLIGQASTVVACNPDHPTHLLGFACGERRNDVLTMHFVCVKFALRGFGVARLMMEAFEYDGQEPIICTHWTHATHDMMRRGRVLVHNPYAMFSEYRDFWRHPDAETHGAKKASANPGWDTTAHFALGARISPQSHRPLAVRAHRPGRPEVRASVRMAARASGPVVRSAKPSDAE